MMEEIRIDTNVYGTVQQRLRMIKKWLEYDLTASWNKLADALEEMGINKVAKDIREKYVHGYKSKFTRGVHLHVYIYISQRLDVDCNHISTLIEVTKFTSNSSLMLICHLHSITSIPHTTQGLQWLDCKCIGLLFLFIFQLNLFMDLFSVSQCFNQQL